MFKSAIKTWLMTLVDLQQVKRNQILVLMIAVIVRVHGIILWMQPNNIGLS